MFYSHDILRRKGGKFGIIWLAAFREKMLTRRDVFSVDVEKSCNDVIEYIVRNYKRDRPRFSLYLSSQLLYGSVKVYRKQAMYLCGDATEMMIKLAAFRDSMTSTEAIDLDIAIRPHHVTLPENFAVSDPYFGTMHLPPLDFSFSVFPEEEFIRVSAVNGFVSTSPLRMPVAAASMLSPLPEKGDTTDDFTDKEQDISFRPEVGPLQATPESITMREAQPFFQAPVMPEVPPGAIDLPVELDFQEGRDPLWTEFWKTDEEIAREEAGVREETVIKEEPGVRDVTGAGDATAPEARDATQMEDATIGQTSVLDDRHQAPILEQTPAVFLDPNAIDMAPQPYRASPEVTAIAPETGRGRRRPRPSDDYSFQLEPIDQAPLKRQRRRQLVFADREIQLTRARMKQNIEVSHETCKPLVYPRPEPSDFKSLFTRPSRPGQWEPSLLALWRRNTRTLAMADPESERQYWTLPSESSPSEFEPSPPLAFPRLDLSPVAEVELRRTQDTSVPLDEQSELMRSADISLQPSVHSISHEMPLDITPMRSSDEGSVSSRPSAKRRRSSTREKRISLEEELSSVAEIQTSQLPGIPEERPSPVPAAAAEVVHGEAVDMSHIPEVPEVPDKDVSFADVTVEKEVPEVPRVPRQVLKDIPDEPGVDPVKRKASMHKDLLRLIRGLTKKGRSTSFFEICPHDSTSRKYAASVFTILLDLCGLEKVCCSQEEVFGDIMIARGRRW